MEFTTEFLEETFLKETEKQTNSNSFESFLENMKQQPETSPVENMVLQGKCSFEKVNILVITVYIKINSELTHTFHSFFNENTQVNMFG
jgi:hypothetical protein